MDEQKSVDQKETQDVNTQSMDATEVNPEEKKPKRKMKVWQIILLVLLVIVVAGIGVIAAYINKLNNNIQRPDENYAEQIITNETPEPATEAAVETEATATPKPQDETRDIVLYGVDARNTSLGKGNRSDCIIIAHINETKKQIKLVSVYRDTYANIPDHGYQKITHAYAFGDAMLSMSTLNINYDLNLKEFVTVNFAVLEDIINELGGVEIDVQPEEVRYVNGYVHSLYKESGINELSYISGSGLQTLNGSQAVAYCRIRYTAGGDMKRAERQRLVLSKIMEKAKTMKVKTLMNIAESASKKVYTSLKLKDILGLVSEVYDYEIVESEGFPYHYATGLVSGASVVKPISYLEDVTTLHRDVYGESDYQPSKKVKSIAEDLAWMQESVTTEDPGRYFDE